MVPEQPAEDDTVIIYDSLLKQALREIRSPASTPGQRTAWARVAEHVLEHLPNTEERVAETLSTAVKVLDFPESVHRLIRGIWSCTGCRSYDGTAERLVGWVVRLADRAIRGRHWAMFAWLAHTAVRLDGVEPDLSAEWERGIRAAYEIPSTWASLYLFVYHYVAKFHPDKETAPSWLRLLGSDRRLHDAFEKASLEESGRCLACGTVGAS